MYERVHTIRWIDYATRRAAWRVEMEQEASQEMRRDGGETSTRQESHVAKVVGKGLTAGGRAEEGAVRRERGPRGSLAALNGSEWCGR